MCIRDSGTGLGLLLALNIESVISGIESIIGFQFFPKDVFYINRFPSKILPSDVLSIVFGAFVHGLIQIQIVRRLLNIVN